MTIKGFFKGILALLLIAFLISLGWSLFTSMIIVFGEYTSTVEPTIVVAIISGLCAIIVNAISKSSERKNQISMKSKEKMTEVYETVLKEFLDAGSEQQINDVFKKNQSVFAVNSSDDTYKEFLDAKVQYETKKQLDISRLITSIRKEIKISNKINKKQEEKR